MKRIKVFLLLTFLLMPICLFAQQPKVYTDGDLEQYKSESEDDSYQYEKNNLENQRQQEIIENYRMKKESSNRERQFDLEKQKRKDAESQKKVDECVEKAQAMIEASTKERKRAGANAKLRAGQVMLDSCYGRSSSNSFDRRDEETQRLRDENNMLENEKRHLENEKSNLESEKKHMEMDNNTNKMRQRQKEISNWNQ